ncbi:MAG: MgtC/SapB family protein [Planctomycetota bacterium]|nr:MgtC/SapB family protein [Planctomycetota bacterium]
MYGFTFEELVPLLLAVVLGGAVGLEREWHGRPAGLRTHILVCLSSTMLIAVSRMVASGDLELGEAGRMVLDPNRMGAGIVTGIGFLGAATVLRIGDLVRGITTAACIWYVAGLGIVLGQGQYAIATVGTAIVVLVLTLFDRVEDAIVPVIYRRLIVHAHGVALPAMVELLSGMVTDAGLRILDVTSSRDVDADEIQVVFFLGLKSSPKLAAETVDRVSRVDGVRRASWSLLD